MHEKVQLRAACKDCLAIANLRRQVIEHDPNCPVRRSQEVAMADDREFFQRNPGETVRERVISWGERAELRILTGRKLPADAPVVILLHRGLES